MTPDQAFLRGSAVRVALRSRAEAALVVRVRVERRGGRVLRRWDRSVPAGRSALRLRWRGVTARGRAAPAGRYRVMAGVRGRRARRIGGFTLRGHAYPVRGRHWFRGAIGVFGAGRSGGRTHEGFDINAACGTPVVAARAGRVRVSRYDPVLYGNVVIVRGERERRDYWYSHLAEPSRLKAGDRIGTRDRIGRVGATGNARSVGCHLHFELRGRGGPLDPLPLLRRWDSWS